MTDMTTVPGVAHVVMVFRDGVRYRPDCSCGWEGEWFRSPVAAWDAGTEHGEACAGAAEDLDQLMGLLLDLQDDMTEVVVWLAEHWSADLPVPVASGVGGGVIPAGVELMVECTTTEDLGRVADLLGTPVADLEHSDPVSGMRFRYTARDFGRVHLEAYTPVVREARP